MDFNQLINERHSIRHFDTEYTISISEIKDIISEAILAPSEYNLQPWHFVVITDEELKNKIYPCAYKQSQILESSALILILCDKEAISVENAEDIYSRSVKEGYMKEITKDSIMKTVKDFYKDKSEEFKNNSIIVDGSLAAMQLMLSAKNKGYDSVPMTGYSFSELCKILSIPNEMTNILMIAIGKAKKPGKKSYRKSVEEIFTLNIFE